MASQRILLLSNSRNVGQGYLEHARPVIRDFLGGAVRRVAFVPWAAVRVTWDDYTAMVRAPMEELGYRVEPVHLSRDPRTVVRKADAIVVGGGNTFHLLKKLQDTGLLDVVVRRVRLGTPYVGWSAGSNVACPTMRTTNDMPIVQPRTLRAMGLVTFQVNPHYLDAHPEGHGGETREERLLEFVEANPGVYVVGLREGSILQVEDGRLSLIGPKPARIFLKGRAPWEVQPSEPLGFLMEKAPGVGFPVSAGCRGKVTGVGRGF